MAEFTIYGDNGHIQLDSTHLTMRLLAKGTVPQSGTSTYGGNIYSNILTSSQPPLIFVRSEGIVYFAIEHLGNDLYRTHFYGRSTPYFYAFEPAPADSVSFGLEVYNEDGVRTFSTTRDPLEIKLVTTANSVNNLPTGTYAINIQGGGWRYHSTSEISRPPVDRYWRWEYNVTANGFSTRWQPPSGGPTYSAPPSPVVTTIVADVSGF